ncbi:MAG: hypothetical protein VCA55_10930 [Verrucomicrobiales bacterium]
MRKVGFIIIALSVVFGLLAVPYKSTRGTASSGPDSAISMRIESSGFSEPEVEVQVMGDASQVKYEYEERWALSYPALAIFLAGLIFGILLVLRSRSGDPEGNISNQALDSTA